MKNIDTLNTIHNFAKNHTHFDALLENLGPKQKYFWANNFIDELKKSLQMSNVQISPVIDCIHLDATLKAFKNSETINKESASILDTLNVIPEIFKIALEKGWVNPEPLEKDILNIMQAIFKYVVNEAGFDYETQRDWARQLIEQQFTHMSTVKEKFKWTIAYHHSETNNVATVGNSLDWNKNYSEFKEIFKDVVAEIQDNITSDVDSLLLNGWQNMQRRIEEDKAVLMKYKGENKEKKYYTEDEYYEDFYWPTLKRVCHNIDDDVIYNFIVKTLTQMCKGNFENLAYDFDDIISSATIAARQEYYYR